MNNKLIMICIQKLYLPYKIFNFLNLIIRNFKIISFQMEKEAFLEALNTGNVDYLRQTFRFDFLKDNIVWVFYFNFQLKGCLTISGKTFSSIPLIHYAIIIKKLNLLQFFLQSGFDVNVTCSNWVPLHTAVFIGAPEFVDILLFYKAKVDVVNDICWLFYLYSSFFYLFIKLL